MKLQHSLAALLLFAGIGALLLIASLIGFLLKRRAAEPSPTIDNLNARIAAWPRTTAAWT